MSYIDNEKNNKKAAQNLARSLKKEMQAFYKLHKQVYQDNILDRKTKELIALGIAISQKCEGCIISHLRSLIEENATREEISEAISVAISMGGGPATVYGAMALEIYDQLLENI